MATLAKQQNQYVKDQFKKMREGSLVSDQEKNSMEGEMVQGAEQMQQAQQAQLGRAAAGQAAGAPMAGQLRKASQDVAKQGQETAAQIKGEAGRRAEALEAQRRGEALGQVSQERELQKQKAELYADIGLSSAKAISGLV